MPNTPDPVPDAPASLGQSTTAPDPDQAPGLGDVRDAIMAFLSAHRDEHFTNLMILDELRKRGVQLRYPNYYLEQLARLARENLIQRVRQGLYTIPSTGLLIHNELHTRQRTRPRPQPTAGQMYEQPTVGQMYELIALRPLLVRSPDGKIFHLVAH